MYSNIKQQMQQCKTAITTVQNRNYFCTSLIIPTIGKESQSKPPRVIDRDLKISKDIKTVIITEFHINLK